MSIVLIAAAQAVPLSVPDPILVTAARVPVESNDSGVSSTVIDEERIESRGEDQVVNYLRTTPGTAISVSGGRGTQAQLRIRGAEANHTLLFIDGISFNAPTTGNEPRFEDILAGGLGRIEIVRGPQSALWGSEAIGGVIALDSPDPLGGTRVSGYGEYGSRDSLRGVLSGTFGDDRHGLTLTASRSESDGIDILGGGTGDRDGYTNRTVGLVGKIRPAPNGEIGVAARYIDAEIAFDGSDPVTFLRADTADTTDAETFGIRGWATLGVDPAMPWSIHAEAQYLDSSNRNFLNAAPRNRTSGDRFRISGQVERRLSFGGTRHNLIAVIEQEDENFQARDQEFGGATDQDRSRNRTAYIGEWRAEWADILTTDITVRHDDFSDFADATTFRALASAEVSSGLSVFASYGEGIAQPTFFDLFGFFPGSFVGNPTLRPERSAGYEIGGQWRGENVALSVTYFRSELENEIVSVFDSTTFLSSVANATGESGRQGIEVAIGATPLPGLRIDANYTYLDADDQQVAGGAELREVRRPRHSANISFDYSSGPLTIGGAIAYVGDRRDTDFDLFPSQTVTLDDYFLASARIGYEVTEGVEVFARGENLFDEEYQDVVGYATPGMAVYGGVRLRFGG